MLKILKNNHGGISMFTLVIMIFLLPFAIWVGIELPKSYEMNQRVKDAVDTASATAVTRTNGMPEDGEYIYINKSDAEKVATQIFSSKLGVEYQGWNPTTQGHEFQIPGKSAIKSIDKYKVRIFDPENPEEWLNRDGQKVETILGDEKITNSSVIVEAQVTFKKIGLFGGSKDKDGNSFSTTTVTHVGISQAVFCKGCIKP